MEIEVVEMVVLWDDAVTVENACTASLVVIVEKTTAIAANAIIAQNLAGVRRFPNAENFMTQ